MTHQPLCIAVDWGTTNLRAYLLDHQGQPQALRQSKQGILSVASHQFEGVLKHLLSDWLRPGVPVLMSGMVGSRGAWHEVPYLEAPLELDKLGAHLHWLTTDWPGPLAIVPGVSSVGQGGFYDVMRGEETQLLGAWDWLQDQGDQATETLCCLPGTHCKWVPLRQGRIDSFSTTFSGELFARLNDESSLVRGLPTSTELNESAFLNGVSLSHQSGGLLHHLFSCRSRYIQGELAADQVRDYLSGIVIGHDIRSMLETHAYPRDVLLIGSHGLCQRYQLALHHEGVSSRFLDAGEASVRGLKRLANPIWTEDKRRIS